MKNLNFINYQDEVSIVEYKLGKYLIDKDPIFFDCEYQELAIEEKLLLAVCDRDGYFFSTVKPSPEFLILLKRHNIYVHAFKFQTKEFSTYGCFLKSFLELNPNNAPLNYYIK